MIFSVVCISQKCWNRNAENVGVEFAALNGYGKPLQNLKLTLYDAVHCSTFDDENAKAAEQFMIAQHEVEKSLTCDVTT